MAVGICRLGGNSDDQAFSLLPTFTYYDQGSLTIIVMAIILLASCMSSYLYPCAMRIIDFAEKVVGLNFWGS